MDKSDISPTKKTNEKPVSLHPVNFKDVLKALLATPPKDQKRGSKKAVEKSIK